MLTWNTICDKFSSSLSKGDSSWSFFPLRMKNWRPLGKTSDSWISVKGSPTTGISGGDVDWSTSEKKTKVKKFFMLEKKSTQKGSLTFFFNCILKRTCFHGKANFVTRQARIYWGAGGYGPPPNSQFYEKIV